MSDKKDEKCSITYALMGENIRAESALLALDELDVGLHASPGKVLREEVRDVCVRVQSTKLREEMSASESLRLRNDIR